MPAGQCDMAGPDPAPQGTLAPRVAPRTALLLSRAMGGEMDPAKTAEGGQGARLCWCGAMSVNARERVSPNISDWQNRRILMDAPDPAIRPEVLCQAPGSVYTMTHPVPRRMRPPAPRSARLD